MHISSNILISHQNIIMDNTRIFKKVIVIGYKISNPEFLHLNTLLTLIGFSIYKAYFLCNALTSHCEIYHIFKSEFELNHLYYQSKQKNIKLFDSLSRFID